MLTTTWDRSTVPTASQQDRDDGRQFVLLGAAHTAPPLAPALYLVATPIGNLGDITIRALQTLAAADIVACEDTRVSRVLADHYGMSTRLIAYHEHNAVRQRPKLLAALAEGRSVALISDAGTPLVSDPGFRLVAEAAAAGHAIVPLPGPSALLAALVASGLATDTFLFAGFLPAKAAARRRRIERLRTVDASLVFYESPHRLAAALQDLAGGLDGDRPAVVARELTKKFETVRRGTISTLYEYYEKNNIKGEVVIVVGPPAEEVRSADIDIDAALREAMARGGASAAAGEVARATGLDRRTLYKRAVALTAGDRRERR